MKEESKTKGSPKMDGSGKGKRVNKRRGGCKKPQDTGNGQDKHDTNYTN